MPVIDTNQNYLKFEEITSGSYYGLMPVMFQVNQEIKLPEDFTSGS